MKLIYDEFEGIHVWVEDHDENVELSPRFDLEEEAVKWQQRMKKILTGRAQPSEKI